MQRRTGNMFRHVQFHRLQWCVTTTNGILNSKGELIMGKGHAKAVKEQWPDVPRQLGEQIVRYSTNQMAPFEYYMMVCRDAPVIALQTKLHWRNDSPPGMVQRSIMMLQAHAKMNPEQTFHTPLPGVGNGGLQPELVRTWTATLPDNVVVWTLQ